MRVTEKVGFIRRENERGGAFIEFSLVIPLLILFIAIIVGLGRFLLAYHQVSAVVYEGARLASKTYGLETALGDTRGVSCTTVSGVSYTTSGGVSTIVASLPASCVGEGAAFPAYTTQHKVIHDRTNTLLALERLRFLGTALWSTRLDYQSTPQTISVTAVGNYPLLWGVLGVSLPLRVTTTLPYLAS